MAEILIRAHNSWMEDVPQEEKDRWDDNMWAKYNRRRRKGNPISVRPDGAKYGKKECPPRYIIVKMPGVRVEDARQYIEKVVDGEEVKFIRRWNFDHILIDAAISTTQGVIETNKTNFEANLTDEALSL